MEHQEAFHLALMTDAIDAIRIKVKVLINACVYTLNNQQ
jgi:hypothetical protein